MERVLIIIEGGIIQHVSSTTRDIDITVVDFDDQSPTPYEVSKKEIDMVSSDLSDTVAPFDNSEGELRKAVKDACPVPRELSDREVERALIANEVAYQITRFGIVAWDEGEQEWVSVHHWTDHELANWLGVDVEQLK